MRFGKVGLIALLFVCWGAAPASAVITQQGTWQAFGGHQYSVFAGDPTLNWLDCKTHAEGLDAHLVTITSSQEDAFVLGLILEQPVHSTPVGTFQEAFIGLWQPTSSYPDQWQWVTGEPYSYRNWSPSNPNGNTNFRRDWYAFHNYLRAPGKWEFSDEVRGTQAGPSMFYAVYEKDYAVPEPSLGLLLLVGIVPLGIIYRRLRLTRSYRAGRER